MAEQKSRYERSNDNTHLTYTERQRILDAVVTETSGKGSWNDEAGKIQSRRTRLRHTLYTHNFGALIDAVWSLEKFDSSIDRRGPKSTSDEPLALCTSLL
jgi:hypothetical protein